MNAYEEIKNSIKSDMGRSAWSKGVALYAMELVDNLELNNIDLKDLNTSAKIEKALLNGAFNWNEYSWGGCSCIYNSDIAKRLCNPTELKITDNGYKNPNRYEEWLDVQARALYQAYIKVRDAILNEVMVF